MKKLQYVFMSLAALLLATPAFAQGTAAGGFNTVPLAAGLGMALAAGLCGLGQGKATASATEALARNPGARPANLHLPHSRSRVHRVAGAIHVRYHLPEGRLV